MPRQPSPRVWKTIAALAAAVAAAALVAGAWRYRSGLFFVPKEPAAETAALAPGEETADIYFADAEYTKLVAERRALPAADTPEEHARLVVGELIAGPTSPDLSPTLPREAQLKSVFLRDGVALLNFDDRLRSKRFGTTGELFALNSLYKTVTANVTEVDGVIVLIDGSSFRTLAGDGGHVASDFPVYGEIGRYVHPPPPEAPE